MLARLPLLALMLVALVTLVACDSGDSGDAVAGGATRIEDLPPEARFVRSESGDTPFEDASAFLDHLPFEPLYPTELPGNRALELAMVTPSPFARDGNDPLARLWLEYRGTGGDTDWVTVEQQHHPMPDVQGAPMRSVDVGGVEGILVDLPNTDGLQLIAHACEITTTLMSHVLTEDELIEMASSMLEGCTPPAEG